MKTGIFYYSITGNTKLLCNYIQQNLEHCELINIAETHHRDTKQFDIVGIISPTYYLNIPPVVETFLKELEEDKDKPLFLAATYGIMTGKIIKNMGMHLKSKGFKLFQYFSLRMPESFPPFIMEQQTDPDAPNLQEIEKLNHFIRRLKESIAKKEILPEKKKVSIGFWNTLIPAPSFEKIKKDFGRLKVNTAVCTGCRKCVTACIYKALTFESEPVFDNKLCRACFSCFNTCDSRAISTTTVSSAAQYTGVSAQLKEKLNGK